MTNVRILNKSNNPNPAYETLGSSGMDVRAFCEESIVIEPNHRALIKTGLHVGLPTDYEIQVRPRSGLALKKGITVVNTPGTVDESYKGEIGIILINHGDEPFVVNSGDRIAQLVLQKVPKINWIPVDTIEELGESERGEGGFGHTGVQ